MIKKLCFTGIAIALIIATAPNAWAESGISVPGPENASPSAQADGVTATPGWNLIGTCEWKVDGNGCLVIRPASNGEQGHLPNKGDLGSYTKWPWHQNNSIAMIRVEGSVICGDTTRSMFNSLSNLQSADLEGLDTNAVADMGLMFYNCSSLASIDLKGFNTSSVENMNGMFFGCSSLSSANLSSFDTSRATDLGGMFHGCSSLGSIDLSSFDTSKVTNMARMFQNCTSLTSINLSGLDTSNVKTMVSLFQGCSRLKALDLSSFDTHSATSRASDAFLNCALDQITLGEYFTLQGQLPNKTWYNAAGNSFKPDSIPSGIEAVYASSTKAFDSLVVSLDEEKKIVTVETAPFEITATISPAMKGAFPGWSSSDPSVASVNPSGGILIHSAGEATIKAFTVNSEDTCELIVQPLTIPTENNSGSNGWVVLEDAEAAKTLKGYSLLIRPSIHKGAAEFEQRLLANVAQQQGKAGTIAELLDVCFVDSTTGAEMDPSVAESLPPLSLSLDLDDDLKTQIEKNNLDLWASSSSGNASKTNAALKNNRFQLLATVPGTYAIIATPKSGSSSDNNPSTNPGDGNNQDTNPGGSSTPSTPPSDEDGPSTPGSGDNPTAPDNDPVTSPDDNPTPSPGDSSNNPPSSSDGDGIPPASSDDPSSESPGTEAGTTTDKPSNSVGASNSQSKSEDESDKSRLAETNGSSSDEEVLPQMGDSIAPDAAPALALAVGATAAAALSANRFRRKG